MRSIATSDRPKRTTALPKGVWFQRKQLSSGETVRYGYWGRGSGSVALGREGSPDFFTKLAAIAAREPDGKTVKHLIWAYRSKVLPKLRARTQADYRTHLDKIEDGFGKLSLRAMSSDHVARHIVVWREGLSLSPRQSDYVVQVLSALLGWGVRQRLLEKNQALGMDRVYSGDRRDKTWTDEQQAAFLMSAPEPLRRAFMLAVATGQRQGDLLRLQWSAIKSTYITLRQSKGSVDVAVPISKSLQACLDDAPRGDSTTVLTQPNGRPWAKSGSGFRSAWGEAARSAGIEGVTFHDLRGTFATRRMAEGWTAEDVALCTGHSLRDLRTLERYVDRRLVAEHRAEAMALRLAQSEA